MNFNSSVAANAAPQTRFDGITHTDVLEVLGNGHFATLRENSKNSRRSEHDPQPVVHLYLTETCHQWLLTEIDGDDVAFGLCDLGVGCPELGYVDLHEVLAAALSVSREQRRNIELRCNSTFRAIAPLTRYVEQARRAQRIVLSWEEEPSLEDADSAPATAVTADENVETAEAVVEAPLADAGIADMAITDAVNTDGQNPDADKTAEGDVMLLAQFLDEFGPSLMQQINDQTPVVYVNGQHESWQDDVLAGLKRPPFSAHPYVLRRFGKPRLAGGVSQRRNGYR